MEKIVSNPGLQHLAENIFSNLNVEDLKLCRQINQSWKQIVENVENPIFWLNKFKSLSKDNLKDWIKIIKLHQNSDKQQAIIYYLQWNLKKETTDLPCYTSPTVQDDFRKKIFEICGHCRYMLSNEDIETVKILVPLTDNPNAPDEDGKTLTYEAACNGHTKIVKILVPLTDNPNSPDKDGKTPIHEAACNGHTKIVKILAPLTDI